MPETGRTVKCRDCGTALDEPTDISPSERKPCPSCGSLSRVVGISFQESLTLREQRRIKARAPSGKKPKHEGKSGNELHSKSCKWMKREMIVDRENDRYYERVIDPETGQVIHECEEPLSQHRGHGSAKKNNESADGV